MPFDGPVIAAAFQNLVNKFKKEAPAAKEEAPSLYDLLDAKFKVGQEFDYLGVKCRVTATKVKRWCITPWGGYSEYFEPKIVADYVDNNGVFHSITFDFDEAMSL